MAILECSTDQYCLAILSKLVEGIRIELLEFVDFAMQAVVAITTIVAATANGAEEVSSPG